MNHDTITPMSRGGSHGVASRRKKKKFSKTKELLRIDSHQRFIPHLNKWATSFS